MPGRRNYTTPHVCIPLNNPSHNIPSDHDQIARQRLQRKLDSFMAEFQGQVFLAVGPDAKLDTYNNFDLSKPFDFNVDPPSTEDPPLRRIIEECKNPTLTTDFYIPMWNPSPGSFPLCQETKIHPPRVEQQPPQMILNPLLWLIPYSQGKSVCTLGCCTLHRCQS